MWFGAAALPHLTCVGKFTSQIPKFACKELCCGSYSGLDCLSFPEELLKLFTELITPFVECCGHVFLYFPSQKQFLFITLLHLLLLSLSSSPLCCSVASLSQFYRYYLCLCWQELITWVHIELTDSMSVSFSPLRNSLHTRN